MAKTTVLSFGYARRFDDGNYGDYKFSHHEEVELEPGDDPNAEYQNLRGRVLTRVNADVQAIVLSRKAALASKGK